MMLLNPLGSTDNRRKSVLPTAVCCLLLLLLTAHCSLLTAFASPGARQQSAVEQRHPGNRERKAV